MHPDPLVDASLLRGWPLPGFDDDSDKHARGTVVVVGGSVQVPGAPLLTGTAALRAGAGKLKVMTTASSAIALGVAMPEAMVLALPETKAGGIHPDGADEVLEHAHGADAVVIGPGMVDDDAIRDLARRLVCGLDGSGPVVIVDARAVPSLPARDDLRRFDGHIVITPNHEELAELLDEDPDHVLKDPRPAATAAARRFGAVVVVRGCIAAPDGRAWRHEGGTAGLGTSGSGDVKSGIVAGLAARGATPDQAGVWGAYVHGRAGELLSQRVASVGYLARELLDVIPEALAL